MQFENTARLLKGLEYRVELSVSFLEMVQRLVT